MASLFILFKSKVISPEDFDIGHDKIFVVVFIFLYLKFISFCFLEDKKIIQPLDVAIHSDLKKSINQILSTLTPREERVLRMRFGLGTQSDNTLEEVGKQFTVTRERIRQIEAKALRKLKHPSRSKRLKSFLD